MPELPEVETIVKRLREVVVGKTIDNVLVHRDKSFQGNPTLILNSKISDVSRRAKLIRFHLDNNLNLLVHLKMTGQLIFISNDGSKRIGGGHPTSDWVETLPSKHTRITFHLSETSENNENREKSNLYFNDIRVFGWVKLADQEAVNLEHSKYAPDIHTAEVDENYFHSALSKTARPIKVAIMDSSIVSGVGNIYACDGLNLARINPERSAKSLSKEESSELLKALKHVINLGIEMGGATIDNYRNVDGFSGKYQEVVRVYGREGEKCENCGNIIVKNKLAGRGTYFCANCQV